MYFVTVHDSLSGDPGPMIIEQFKTLEEAYSYGGELLIECAWETQDDGLAERAATAPLFMALGMTMRMGGILHAGIDGYEVLISNSEGSTAPYGGFYEDVTQYTEVMPEGEGAMFLQYIMGQADPKVMPWLNKCYVEWCSLAHVVNLRYFNVASDGKEIPKS